MTFKVIVLSPIFVVCFFMNSAFSQDLEVLVTRLDSFYSTGQLPFEQPPWWDKDTTDPGTWLSSQESDGSWSDIPYDNTHLENWLPTNHLIRLRFMAAAFKTQGSGYYDNNAMRDAIINGLSYWYTRKPVSSNWWHNDAGQQNHLGPLLIMMRDYLTMEQLNTGLTFMREPARDFVNKIWLAQQGVWKGALEGNLQEATADLQVIKDEIRVSTESQGIQPDQGIHMHGPAIVNGTYGLSLVVTLAFWIHMTRDLSFDFSDPKVKIIEDIALDGTQWMVRRDYIDHFCLSRSFTRSWATRADHPFFTLPLRLFEISSTKSSEYTSYMDHIEGNDDGALVGSKYFWHSDYYAHRRPGYYIGTRFLTNRTVTQEHANQENTQGLYMNQGAVNIVRHGKEYEDIYPMWNWGLVPGVTGPHVDPAPAANHNSWHFGTSTFGGGVTDGEYGAGGTILDWDGVLGKKSWFYFDREIVFLGSDISANNANPVATSINQTHVLGEIWASTDTGPGTSLSSGEQEMNLKWAFHDSVGYVFPTAQDVMIKHENQSGSWGEINVVDYQKDVTVSGDVFSLWYDHGMNPSNGEYEYVVVPGIGKTELQQYSSDIPITVLSRSATVHAVYHKQERKAGAVFYASGSVTIRDGLELEVDGPSLVLLVEKEDEIVVSVSDPHYQSGPRGVQLIWSSSSTESQTVSLPSGNDVARTVTTSFENRQPVAVKRVSHSDNIHFQRMLKGDNLRILRVNPMTGKKEYWSLKGEFLMQEK